MRRFSFVTLDVFSDRPLEGNPLAVFPNAAGLTDSEMLAVAREFNLSETTFVFRRERAVENARGIRTRIFSTRGEMPFAGHPTLGTAGALRDQGEGDAVALELNVGRVPVHFSERDGHPYGEMTQPDPTFGMRHDREKVADAIGLPPSEIANEGPIETVSTGTPFVIVPFRRLATLERWAPDWHRMEQYLRDSDAQYFYAICRETVSPDAQVHARMVFYGGDDPATGSAAGPAGAWMVRHGLARLGTPVAIEQGFEVHRPSRLTVTVDRTEGSGPHVRVGGGFVPVQRGTLELP